MTELVKIKFNSNLATSISWGAREEFKQGTEIVVPSVDALPLLRLGCTIVWKFVLNYKGNEKFVDELIRTYEIAEEAKQKAIELANEKARQVEAKRVKELEKAEAKKRKEIEDKQKAEQEAIQKLEKERLAEIKKAKQIAEDNLIEARAKAKLEAEERDAKVEAKAKELKSNK